MNTAEVKRLQRAMNAFTDRFLENFPPVMEDGVRGPPTNRRISECKLYLGYKGGTERSHRVTKLFLRRLADPNVLPPAMKALAEERRRKQHERARQIVDGVAMFDGRPVAAWLKPYLDFARANGWRGTLNSGFRTPERSEEICFEKCGHPTCADCAGKSSNHSGKVKPRGAIDVSDFTTFGQLMRQCPLDPPIFNAVAGDPVHFSATGH
jgi:hypothetical protein